MLRGHDLYLLASWDPTVAFKVRFCVPFLDVRTKHHYRSEVLAPVMFGRRAEIQTQTCNTCNLIHYGNYVNLKMPLKEGGAEK